MDALEHTPVRTCVSVSVDEFLDVWGVKGSQILQTALHRDPNLPTYQGQHFFPTLSTNKCS